MTARNVFCGIEYGRMLLANEHLAIVAEDVKVTLPRLINRIKQIDGERPKPWEPMAVAA